jgi:hypothetical protein
VLNGRRKDMPEEVKIEKIIAKGKAHTMIVAGSANVVTQEFFDALVEFMEEAHKRSGKLKKYEELHKEINKLLPY